MSVLGKWCRYVLAAVVLCSLFAGQAQATTFFFLGGDVRVTAFRSDDPSTLLVDETFPLSGSYISVSTAPVGITDFLLTIPQSAFTLSAPFGGYDEVVIESATLTPGAGFTSTGLQTSPFTYDVDGSPVEVNSIYSATDSSATNPPINDVPLPAFDTSFDGTFATDLVLAQLNGITLGVIPGAWVPVPETADLIVKGDITFFGVVPEPTTGTLLFLGLAGLGLARNKNRF